jgi:metal-responsive CopG/Arc/MetJ family transcriptional regulator
MADKIKSRISITIAPMINDMLDKVSKRANISKSLLVEKALKSYLKGQLEADAKALSKLTFDDLPDENEWLNLQPKLN